MRTVEFQVPGLIDGTTPAPVVSLDPKNESYKAPDADGIVRFTPAEMIARTGGNLGLFDADLGIGNAFADQFLQLLEVVSEGSAPSVSIEIVDGEDLTLQQSLVAGPETRFYDKDLILVPQGSQLRFSGYTATPDQPVVIRICVVTFTSIHDYTNMRLVACCTGGGNPAPGGHSGPVYVYRPGGLVGDNVYADFPSLTDALALEAGPKWVQVDDTYVAVPLVPTGVWDVNGAIFEGRAGQVQTILRASPGARIINLPGIGMGLSLQSEDPAAAVVQLGAAEVFDVAQGASLASLAGQPVLDVPGVGQAVVRLAASSLVAMAGPSVGVSGGAGASLLLQLWEGSTVEADTVASAIGASVTVQIRSSASSFSRDQAALLGTLALSYFVDDQRPPVTVAGGPLPVAGYVHVAAGPVDLPLASRSAGPIVVRNASALVLTVNAGMGDTVDGGASKALPPGAVVVFKSDGLLAWQTEQKSFVEFDAAGMPIPGQPHAVDFGAKDIRWRGIHNRLDIRVASTYLPGFNNLPLLTYNPDAVGKIQAFTVGYGFGGVTEIYCGPTRTAHDVAGRVANFDAASTARLRQMSTGFLRGNVYTYNAGTSKAEIDQAGGAASFIGGYVACLSANDAILRHGPGAASAFSWCRVYAYASNGGSPLVYVTGESAVTFVNAGNEARVYSRHLAAFMQGICFGTLPEYALMENVEGAAAVFIQGRCQTLPGFDAKMRVEDDAGWATGRASGATIETRSGQAAWARGFAQSGAAIYASGHGSTAWGWAPAGQVIGVAANNSDQWGVGVNTLADSSRFGVGWRFKKTNGPPATPVDGDAWKDGPDLGVFSGGASRNLSQIPTMAPLATLSARGSTTTPPAAVDELAYDTTNKKWVRCESIDLASSVWVATEGRDSVLYQAVPAFNRLALPCVISDEPFVGNLVSNSEQAQGYTLITTTGTSVASRIPTGSEARGVVRFTGTAATFAGSGIRQLLDAIGPDGFGNGREFAWACRVRPSSAVPVVADRDYAVFAGLATQSAGLAEPTDGPYWYIDKDTATWTLKAARDSNRSPQASALGWDTVNYHWLAFLVAGDGTTLTGFVDGVEIAPILGANVQPNDGIQSGFYAESLGASTQDLVVDIDHIVWGWTEAA